MTGPSRVFRQMEAALRARAVVRLGVAGNEAGSAPFGVPVVLSQGLVILQFLRDFRRDGFVAVPVERVAEVRRSAFERTYTDICRSEGLLDRVGAGRGLDAAGLAELFVELRRSRRYLLITPVDGKPLLGQLRAAGEAAIRLRPFDATGTFQPEVQISLPDILDVQWNSRYLKVWQRYLDRST